jgi:hypothetical protein
LQHSDRLEEKLRKAVQSLQHSDRFEVHGIQPELLVMWGDCKIGLTAKCYRSNLYLSNFNKDLLLNLLSGGTNSDKAILSWGEFWRLKLKGDTLNP